MTGFYHIRQIVSTGLTIAASALQLKASPNSGIFTTTPLIRYLGGECGSVAACKRKDSGRSSAQAHKKHTSIGMRDEPAN